MKVSRDNTVEELVQQWKLGRERSNEEVSGNEDFRIVYFAGRALRGRSV